MNRWSFTVAGTCLLLSLPVRAQEIYSVVASTPPLTVHGADPQDELASAPISVDVVAVGDLNGDGVPDLAIGVPHGDGRANSQTDLGEVHVFFGPLLTGQVWDLATRPADLTIYGPEAAGLTGSAVEVTDIDGDGAADLIIGSPNVDRPFADGTWRGEVSIFFGPLAPGVTDLAVTEPGLRITGRNPRDGIADAIAVGDLSGDGIPDLLLGDEWGRYGSPFPNAGGAHVIFGPVLPGPPRDLSVTPPDMTLVGDYNESGFVHRARIRDISGDGQPDLVLSASTWPGSTGFYRGRVVALFGPFTSGTFLDFATITPDVEITSPDDLDEFGNGLDAVDLDGDGTVDLIVGANWGDGPANARADCGEVHVYFGPFAAGTRIDNVTTFPDILFFGAQFDRMGNSVCAARMPSGDVMLAMTAVDAFQTGCHVNGELRVMKRLPPRGSIIDLLATPSDLTVSPGTRGIDFGGSCYLADLSGDTVPELLAGSLHDGPAFDRDHAGALYVVGPDDRCEEVPPEAAPTELRVRRSGDDLLLEFDATGFGIDSVAADIFRGTIASLWSDAPAYDHVPLVNACGVMASPFLDVGAAMPGVGNGYYLIAHGCPSACWIERQQSSLGVDSLGNERPHPGPIVDLATCR